MGIIGQIQASLWLVNAATEVYDKGLGSLLTPSELDIGPVTDFILPSVIVEISDAAYEMLKK